MLHLITAISRGGRAGFRCSCGCCLPSFAAADGATVRLSIYVAHGLGEMHPVRGVRRILRLAQGRRIRRPRSRSHRPVPLVFLCVDCRRHPRGGGLFVLALDSVVPAGYPVPPSSRVRLRLCM